ncbi:unnamed protein product [Lactuca saligna]|uniref:Uncharacterized protein n=1 Tax=Lactuca saligna TaxID=75948 RepID=A0AA36E824_LACSI|nr:unnamed protein product [Lactuca saligna]
MLSSLNPNLQVAAARIYVKTQTVTQIKISSISSIMISISHYVPPILSSTIQNLNLFSLDNNMLLKLFGSRTNIPNPKPNPSFEGIVVGEKPLILQIIHAGGVVERHYMAFPASSIIDKYPNFVLARPEIFRQPWDSIVPPEEILVPGQKYFLVPLRTVKKLRRRARNPSNYEMPNSLICRDENTPSTKSSLLPKPKPISCNRRVRFKGIDSKTPNAKGSRKKLIVRFAPSLTVIDETQGFDD